MSRNLRLIALLACFGLAAIPQPAAAGVHLHGSESPAQAPDDGAREEREPPPSPRLTNPAQLNLTISPGSNARIGDKLTFRVTAKKKGYLILIDVDADGHVTQIFPNFLSLAAGEGSDAERNRLGASSPVMIPAEGSKLYEFVASAPPGVGMTLAIFSEAPIEMVDLPDVPSEVVGSAEAADFLRKAADGLQIVSPDPDAGLQSPNFSYAAQFYRIR